MSDGDLSSFFWPVLLDEAEDLFEQLRKDLKKANDGNHNASIRFRRGCTKLRRMLNELRAESLKVHGPCI